MQSTMSRRKVGSWRSQERGCGRVSVRASGARAGGGRWSGVPNWFCKAAAGAMQQSGNLETWRELVLGGKKQAMLLALLGLRL